VNIWAWVDHLGQNHNKTGQQHYPDYCTDDNM
jgi:hypothetical protein